MANTEDLQSAAERRPSRSSGRDAKRAARAARSSVSVPYITRSVPYYEVVSEEGLAVIERNAETILAEYGIEFREDDEALAILRAHGADVQGSLVRFPRGLCRELVQKHAPREFVQYARNPARNVRIGGNSTVFAPAYGSPFILNATRAAATRAIDDFQNFVKLAYMANSLHHSGGTICEPVDLPVNKRHLDMVYSHIKYSDKPFMGSVTAPERAQDSVEMARIAVRRGGGRPGTGKLAHDDDQPHQRELADGLRRDDARRAQGLCARQPGDDHHAVHSRGRDVAGHGGGHGCADAGRGAGGHGVRADGEPRRARGDGQLRVVHLHAVRRAHVRHARTGPGALHDGGARASTGRAVPFGRQPVRLQGRRRAGGVRIGARRCCRLASRA